ncbi:MAG TPA: hypothetical protein VK327_08305 [Candidatus Paceibacterota bacterium]|nr:hypothetical protein [Candidatus Paceibacterota bacterium]
MNDLERRKRMLIVEAAVYRETLKLEVQNFRIYGIKTRRRLMSFGGGNPLLAMGLPMLTSLIAGKRRARKWGALAFIGWQLYSRLGRAFADRSSCHVAEEESAAEEYLQRRL